MAEVLAAGAPLARARAAAILVHGRGASAEDILTLADEFAQGDIAYLAPQAAGRTWYPYSFLSPIPKNEPGITSALGVIARLVESTDLGSERRRNLVGEALIAGHGDDDGAGHGPRRGDHHPLRRRPGCRAPHRARDRLHRQPARI